MLLPIHIAIALSSLIITAFAYIHPSNKKLTLSSTLVALTLISGTILVISMHTNPIRTCITGLIYLVIVSTGIVLARRKLLHQHIDS